jgi:hypothetical protein
MRLIVLPWPRQGLIRVSDIMLQFKRIFIGSRCQNSCPFCAAAGREAEPARAQVEAALREASAENVVFHGGEPLLRTDLPELARLAVRRGARRLKVRTNARALAGTDLLAVLLEAGVYFFEVKVCGPAPEVHDAVCGSRGFEETFAGLSAIREVSELRGAELRPYLECVVPVVKENLDLLEPTLHGLLTFQPDRLHFELSDPDLGLLKAAPYLKAALETALFNKVWATTLGLPLCVMGGFEPHVREALPGAASGRKLKPCKRCVLREVCAGVDARLLSRQGERQVEAQLEPASAHRHLEGLRLLRQPLKAAP